jgi:hypothetical protein
VLGDGRRSTVSNRRRRNGRGAGNEGKDVVEVVVIPITAEPRRIGRVRVRDWRQSDDQDRENGTEHAAEPEHAPMIAAMVGQVKRVDFKGRRSSTAMRSANLVPLRKSDGQGAQFKGKRGNDEPGNPFPFARNDRKRDEPWEEHRQIASHRMSPPRS